MEIPVIIEPYGAGWRACCRHPVEASATGDTRYEATQALEAILRAAIADPFTLLPLEVTPDKPWLSFAGSIADDELTMQWLQHIAENRHQRDVEDQQILTLSLHYGGPKPLTWKGRRQVQQILPTASRQPVP